MNWFKKAISGEYFIDDSGYATSADGDIDDVNHEAYALQTKVPDHLGEKYDSGRLTKRERKEIGEDFLQYMETGGEARTWMVEREGWIRVHGNNFELAGLDQEKIDRILNFFAEENGGETDPDEGVYIDDIANNRSYSFTYGQLQNAVDNGTVLSLLTLKGDEYSVPQQDVPQQQVPQAENPNQMTFDFAKPQQIQAKSLASWFKKAEL